MKIPDKIWTFGSGSYPLAAKLVGAIQVTFGTCMILLLIHVGLMSYLIPKDVSGLPTPENFCLFVLPTLVIGFCSICMGVSLLDGVFTKSPIQSGMWIVSSTVFLIGSVGGLSLSLEMDESLIPFELKVTMTFGMLVQIYMFQAVARYHKRLKAELANKHQRLGGSEADATELGNCNPYPSFVKLGGNGSDENPINSKLQTSSMIAIFKNAIEKTQAESEPANTTIPV